MSLRDTMNFISTHQHLNTILMCFSWYFVSSLTSQSTKYILTRFSFPVFVGESQFFFSAMLGIFASTIFANNQKLASYFPKHSIPSESLKFSRSVFQITLPMGFFQFFGKLFGLSATSMVSVGTVASVRSLSPLLIVMGYKFYYRVQFPLTTYLSLVPLVLGVVTIVVAQAHAGHTSADLHDPTTHIKGVLCAFTSALIFAVQSIYAKNVVTVVPQVVEKDSTLTTDPGKLAISEDKDNADSTSLPIYEKLNKKPSYLNISQSYIRELEKPDKLTTLVYCAVFGFCLSFPVFLMTEFRTLLFDSKVMEITAETASTQATMQKVTYFSTIPWAWLFLNGVSHFAQALLAFHILGALPTVTYSIASMLKRIVLIVVSMIMTGNAPTFMEFLGLLNVAIGLYAYDKWGSHKR